MEIKKEESEFAQFPVDQVVDWLGHPVTEHLSRVIQGALVECGAAAQSLCDESLRCAPDEVKAQAMAIGAGAKAYQQLRKFFEEAGEYVKA